MSVRRPRLGAAVLAAVLLLLTSACEWTAFGGGPARDGHNTGERTLGITNVPDLEELWSASIPSDSAQPVVAHGYVYIGADDLLVFKAADGDGAECSGTPRVCAPLWTAAIGGRTSPTIAGDTVYSVEGATLAAYDANGVTGCGGAPKVCTPLWTATVGGSLGSPVVADGVVYVGANHLYAFDAAGTIGCGGTPKTCTPMWASRSSVGVHPAVADGRVYVNDAFTLSAFDAGGQEGCTAGTPRTCDPLWSYEKVPFCSGSCPLSGPPAVSGGRVYLLDSYCCGGGMSSGSILAFDAAGQLGCSGSPTTCQPVDGAGLHSGLSFPKPGIAVADGHVFATDFGMTALDTGQLDKEWGETPGAAVSGPTVANGVVYALTSRLVSTSGPTFAVAPAAFDAKGQIGCTGTPKTCAPLWTGTETPLLGLEAIFDIWQGPVVVGGRVYVVSDILRVYGVPDS